MHYLVLLSAIVWSFTSGVAHGASSIQRESLRDLPGVTVVVEEVPSDAQAEGLSEELIRAAAERSLQSRGTRILTPVEQASSPSKPSLYVRVGTYRIQSNQYVYVVTVALKQSVVLAHRPQRKMFASTWEQGVIGTPGANSLGEATKVVEDLVSAFANDFQAVNNQDAVREEK
ncbi:exported protein of unknown function [Nitrospira japonica]|uniref:Lipoprotein n=1 Tax=Nitrospira japonica TaxID=1325564 RepID=A0A1W1I141_9BACT|nr:hypothetical protein [Nitrospira japonica]SLM46553.1 exported protein of unknown function [Nitrospira japonica]